MLYVDAHIALNLFNKYFREKFFEKILNYGKFCQNMHLIYEVRVENQKIYL